MMLPMLMIVLTLTFFLSRAMVINPFTNNLADYPDLLEMELERIGYYTPWYLQLGNYFLDFFTGNWGISNGIDTTGTPVLQIVSQVFPRTVELMIIPLILSPIIAVKLGLISSTHKDTRKDIAIRTVAILGAGFPVFWIGSIVKIIFGFLLPLFTLESLDFPTQKANSVGFALNIPDGAPTTGFRLIDCIIYNDQIFLWDTILHLILPALCVTFVSLATIARQTRSSMLDVLDQDYIRTARAKGVKESDVINKHALRNALLPVSNVIIGGTTTTLLGSFFIEVTFVYNGFGRTMVWAILGGDYLLINGLLVIGTIIILIGNLVTDVMYTIIDPRITYK